jgi:hypothetical protein
LNWNLKKGIVGPKDRKPEGPVYILLVENPQLIENTTQMYPNSNALTICVMEGRERFVTALQSKHQ